MFPPAQKKMPNPLMGLMNAAPDEPEDTGEQLPQDDPQVKYEDGSKGAFRCDLCEHFMAPNACSKVSGVIDPAGCSNLFERKEGTGMMNQPTPMGGQSGQGGY